MGTFILAVGVRTWLGAFLDRRGLREPDGRPLYAYQCTQAEFAELTERLAGAALNHGLPGPQAVRGFVLYASQWWQRRYSGGPWSWDSVFQDIGWMEIHYPNLHGPVRRALGWWQVELVRLSTSTRYLGTLACQGGLPLSLVGESSRTTAYLRAVLRHVARYRSFVDDSIELARDQQHLLRPPTLRREYVFRLAAKLVDAVLDLRQYIGKGDDLLAELDARRPEWRKTMPLDLDSETARQLLGGLLREAKAGGPSGGSSFGVERFLVPTDAGWRLGARLRMPRSIGRDDLSRHLRVPETDLPARMYVRTAGESGQVVGLYGAGGEHFHLMSSGDRPSASLWDTAAVGELRLEFLAQDVLGEVTTRRSASLGELPWVFRADGDYAFVGEGSVSDRAPELLALLPASCQPSSGDALGARVEGRHVWRIVEPAVVPTDSGTCEIKPASAQMVEEEYRLAGDRFYSLTSTSSLFRGKPSLITSKAEGGPRTVPRPEVNWRRTGRGWQSSPDGYGMWEVRHLQEGVLRHHERVGLLPENMSLSIEPRSVSEGDLVLDGGDGAAVANDTNETRLEVDREAETLRLRLSAAGNPDLPAQAALRLRWPEAEDLRVRAPFPAAGARFVKDGEPLKSATLAVDELYGVRATALSSDETQRFWIEGELKAEDALPVQRVAHFRHALRRSGTRHEIALVEIDSTLRLLLGASAAQDARVTLRIIPNTGEHGTVDVRRFAAALRHDSSMASVLVEPPLDFRVMPSFEALSLARTDLRPVPLTPVGPTTSPVCAQLPGQLNAPDEPWLVVLRGDDGTRAAPVVVESQASRPRSARSLSDALALADARNRMVAIEAALNAIVAPDGSSLQEADWAFLDDMLHCLDGVPPSASDLISALPRCPQVLVRCLFRLDPSVRRRLWQLDSDLPFSWLLIKRHVWRHEAKMAYDEMCEELRGAVDSPAGLAREHLLSVLKEGAGHVGALETLVTDVEAMLEGGQLSGAFVQQVCQVRDRHRQHHVQQLASGGNWPGGYTRRDWSDELNDARLSRLPIMDVEDAGWRQPTFDTPVAAAWCCFVSDPSRRTHFLVERMRAHEPDWFDIAYQAAWYQLARAQDRSNDG